MQTRVESGSSPRTWGTQLRLADPNAVHPHARGERAASAQQSRSRHRFIPTHVGNAAYLRRTLLAVTVHPHARGERLNSLGNQSSLPGSSPRTWGTPRDHDLHIDCMRFIPTHVGNAWRNYPLNLPPAGSSPRTWGTPHSDRYSASRRRFIPTHVGNAAQPNNSPPRWTVHPHARGERARNSIRMSRQAGSSPRTWGTRPDDSHLNLCAWFIPTHVGNALGPLRCQPLQRGSSPRTWGTPSSGAQQSSPERFIPTHVGNATLSSSLRADSTVHPHARGERSR